MSDEWIIPVHQVNDVLRELWKHNQREIEKHYAKRRKRKHLGEPKYLNDVELRWRV